MIYEVSEGMINGLSDYELVFKKNLQDLLVKCVGEEMAGLANMILGNQFWM